MIVYSEFSDDAVAIIVTSFRGLSFLDTLNRPIYKQETQFWRQGAPCPVSSGGHLFELSGGSNAGKSLLEQILWIKCYSHISFSLKFFELLHSDL